MEGIDFLKVVISEITGEVRVIADKNFIKMDKRKRTEYLEEKIEVAKSRKLNNKQGYLIEAVRQDYKNISGNKMNKFQNFNSTLDKYSSDELEEKIRQSQNKKFG